MVNVKVDLWKEFQSKSNDYTLFSSTKTIYKEGGSITLEKCQESFGFCLLSWLAHAFATKLMTLTMSFKDFS